MDIAYVDVEFCIRKCMRTCLPSGRGMAGLFMSTFQNLSRLSLRTASNSGIIPAPLLNLWQMIGLSCMWPSLRELVLVHIRVSEEGLVSLPQNHASTLWRLCISGVRLVSGGSCLSLFRSVSTFLNLMSASIDHLHWDDPRCLTHPSYSTGDLSTETTKKELGTFLVDGGLCPVVAGRSECNLISNAVVNQAFQSIRRPEDVIGHSIAALDKKICSTDSLPYELHHKTLFYLSFAATQVAV
jgi:hypothetical protein